MCLTLSNAIDHPAPPYPTPSPLLHFLHSTSCHLTHATKACIYVGVVSIPHESRNLSVLSLLLDCSKPLWNDISSSSPRDSPMSQVLRFGLFPFYRWENWDMRGDVTHLKQEVMFEEELGLPLWGLALNHHSPQPLQGTVGQALGLFFFSTFYCSPITPVSDHF